ncbi:nickel pincer cofactor biosynthesis protein LarB [Biomaibacter acetigenes]|uniref:Nickel pincer cofactor biosynthesis protein LarB n=1 Tax=Biomaibacter acetigenes TaxID=2316383 RepID=A0A3G2RCB7_9FIRM|nr:nickel pincer cofactor biosynthesis protein LarB [Biomaibacter acetigenes]
MNLENIRELLEDYKNDRVTIDKVIQNLRDLPYEDLGFARIDHHRALRRGVPEVIFCQGKTLHRIIEIVRHMLVKNSVVMGTRADKNIFEEVKKIAPDAKYYDDARIFLIEREKLPQNKGVIAVVSAGTSDIPVAEEAAVTAEVFGNEVERLYDVGVAGIHRLFMNMDVLHKARVVIVVAGMEGALASVVAGLVDKPVIAVPTSVGYGASFHGLSALLTMLNSCAGGITVVNIDNGFGAGFAAHQINKLGG